MGFFDRIRVGFGKAVGHAKQTFHKVKHTVGLGFHKAQSLHTSVGNFAKVIDGHLKNDLGAAGRGVSHDIHMGFHTNGHPLHQIHHQYKRLGAHVHNMQQHFPPNQKQLD